MSGPIFLTLNQVLRLHAIQIEQFGGPDGVLDIRLVESAIAQPQQVFGHEFLHKDLPEMAAAYLFHLIKNHGFVDGNKRTGSDAALTFLRLNEIATDRIDEVEMETLTMSVAEGTADKGTAAAFFRTRVTLDE